MPDVELAGPAAGQRRSRVAPFVAIGVAIVLIALFVVLAGADPGRNESATTPLLDRPAPAATGVLADDTPFELSRRRGSWVVLNFFTHTCVPCIREHPELVRFDEQQSALGVDGAELYSIVRDSTREEVADFFDARGGDWPVVFDPRFEFVNGFGITLVPETWVIDPDGFVRARFINEITADGLSSVLQQMRVARG